MWPYSITQTQSHTHKHRHKHRHRHTHTDRDADTDALTQIYKPVASPRVCLSDAKLAMLDGQGAWGLYVTGHVVRERSPPQPPAQMATCREKMQDGRTRGGDVCERGGRRWSVCRGVHVMLVLVAECCMSWSKNQVCTFRSARCLQRGPLPKAKTQPHL